MVQEDPGKDAAPQDEDVSDTVDTPEGAETEEDRKVRSQSPDGRSWRERLSTWASREYWRGFSWRDLPRLGSTAMAWRLRGLWRRGGSRFEPGPLGLLGVMLAAMAITMLLLQTGSGGIGGDGTGRADEPVSIPGPPEGELRIMPLGGAATQGSDGDHTWRYHLWSHLTEQEVEFDFVGPHDDLYSLEEEDFGNHDYAAPDFDTDHAARWTPRPRTWPTRRPGSPPNTSPTTCFCSPVPRTSSPGEAPSTPSTASPRSSPRSGW